MRTARTTRAAVAAALLVSAALTLTSVLLMPDFSGGHADRLLAIGDAPRAATVSALGFTLAQLFLAPGILGIAHLARHRTPVLALVGGTLAALGCFGHAVHGGVNVVMLSMAADPGGLDTHVGVLARTEEGVGIPFMAAGLLGTVLGFVVLGVALWHGRLGPRWLGPAMIGWVVVEFGASGLSDWAGYASGLLYAGIVVALARTVWRSSPGHWVSAAAAGGPTSAGAAADDRVGAQAPVVSSSAS